MLLRLLWRMEHWRPERLIRSYSRRPETVPPREPSKFAFAYLECTYSCFLSELAEDGGLRGRGVIQRVFRGTESGENGRRAEEEGVEAGKPVMAPVQSRVSFSLDGHRDAEKAQ